MSNQEWDYCQCRIFGTEDRKVVVSAPGRGDKTTTEISPDEGKTPWDAWMTMIGKLGDEGWEMVNATDTGQVQSVWFKRPRQTPAKWGPGRHV